MHVSEKTVAGGRNEGVVLCTTDSVKHVTCLLPAEQATATGQEKPARSGTFAGRRKGQRYKAAGGEEPAAGVGGKRRQQIRV